MANLYGYAILEDVDPRLVLVSANACVTLEDTAFPAKVRIATRGKRTAAVFEIDGEYASEPLRIYQGPGYRAKAHGSEPDGLVVIEQIRLTRCSQDESHCWRSGQKASHFDDDRQKWWSPTMLALLREHTLQIPVAGRPLGDGPPLELNILGEIGDGRYPADQIMAQIREARDRTIVVNLDSGGGNAREGLAIYNALAAHPKRVEVQIVGRAHSIAAIIALAGDFRSIVVDGSILLHEVSLPSPLNAKVEDLTALAAEMKKLNARIAAIIASRAKLDFDVARGLVEAETTIAAGYAVTLGLAHSLMLDIPAAMPTTPKARFQAIAGPYQGIRPKSAPAPLYAVGGRFRAGQRVRHLGKEYIATRATFAAPGLEPDREPELWTECDA